MALGSAMPSDSGTVRRKDMALPQPNIFADVLGDLFWRVRVVVDVVVIAIDGIVMLNIGRL